MDLTPYKNGVHSLAEGLRCLDDFLKNKNDPYLMKEVILKIHHGLETLLKDIVFQRNPVFLLTDETSVSQILNFYKGFYEGQNEYLFDDAKTIAPEQVINRIKDLKIISGIGSKDYRQLSESFKTLNAVRNQLQHFAIKANSDIIIRVLGNLIPRTVEILKNYYSNGGQSPYNPRVNALPHTPLPGMERLFGQPRNLEKDLNDIYPNASNVISEIEGKYDLLLTEAISRLQATQVEGVRVCLKLRDHGAVGAPPYMPEFTLEGWLNEKFEPHRNSKNTRFPWQREPLVACYEASINISQPEVIQRAERFPQESITKLRIDVEAIVDVLDGGFFNIPQLNDYLPFIKSPKVNALLALEITSSGLFNEHHFDVSTVLDLKGKLKFDLTSSIFGDPENKPSVHGFQEIQLNNDNTSIRFHAFVESNNKLRDHHSLEISVDDSADIVFD